MVYTDLIREAVSFAIKTHEIDQKQLRKGKDIPYITHPLTVGIILARAGASEEVVAAGILHDTIEDSDLEKLDPKKKVTRTMLAERFGERIADIVASVSDDKELSTIERKRGAIERIKAYGHDSLLVKSADSISNVSETLEDHDLIGDAVFNRFSSIKEEWIGHHIDAMNAIIERWPDNPLANDLRALIEKLKSI